MTDWDEALSIMYGDQARTLLARSGVRPVPPGQVPAGLPVVGVVDDGRPWTGPDAVVASACVDHAAGDATGLSASVVADIVIGASVAAGIGVPLISFVNLGQEVNLVPAGPEGHHGWSGVRQRVEAVFSAVAPPGSALVDTADPTVWATLADRVGKARPDLPDAALDGLYHPCDESSFPRGTPFGYYYDYYRFNIVTYLPEVIGEVVGIPVRDVLVVENVQQVNAVRLAAGLARTGSLRQWVTLPAPDRTGTSRATRSTGADRVPFDDFGDGLPGMVTAATSRRYWEHVVDLWRRLDKEPTG
jgi:hypothetical protein